MRRERCRPDRRQVIAYLTDEGRALLERLDPLVGAAGERAMGVLSADEVATLVALLDRIRCGLRGDD